MRRGRRGQERTPLLFVALMMLVPAIPLSLALTTVWATLDHYGGNGTAGIDDFWSAHWLPTIRWMPVVTYLVLVGLYRLSEYPAPDDGTDQG